MNAYFVIKDFLLLQFTGLGRCSDLDQALKFRIASDFTFKISPN